jgi:hypothetical protein
MMGSVTRFFLLTCALTTSMGRAFALTPVISYSPSKNVYTAITTLLRANTGAAVSDKENNLTQKLAQSK